LLSHLYSIPVTGIKPTKLVFFIHGLAQSSTWAKNFMTHNYPEMAMQPVHFVYPDAPFDTGALFASGGIGGKAWFRQINDDEVTTDYLNASIQELVHLIKTYQETYGIGPDHTMVSGFSQGGTMSTTLHLRYPGLCRYSASIAGYIANPNDPNKILTVTQENKYLWIHGTQDSDNPYYLATKGMNEILNISSATLLTHSSGHVISRNIIRTVMNWFAAKGDTNLLKL
jgi:phospholipase/carboxylesterase